MKSRQAVALAVGIGSIVAAWPVAVEAGIKLITLPPRERVEIQLDHPQVTLVEEERNVPLAAGANDVVFAWANTTIDPASIRLRCLSGEDRVRVLSVSYPPGESALIWQVWAGEAGSARVRISYLIGQLEKSFAYRAVSTPDERTLDIWQYVQLHNRANEEFDAAGMWTGFGERFERPIGINETRQVLAARFSDVPIRKKYTADLVAHGYLDEGKKQLRVPMHYVLVNDAAHGLGRFPLVFGKVRVFQDDGRGTEAFLGEDWGRFTPRDDKMELYLGLARDVVVVRTIERRDQVRVLGNLYDYDVVVKYEVENCKDQPVVLDIAETLPALRAEIGLPGEREVEWELGAEGTLNSLLDAEESTADRILFHVDLPPRAAEQQAVKQVHKFHVRIRNEW